MARYYLDKRMTITGLVPGSNVGVWKSNDPKQGTFDSTQAVFLERCQEDTISFRVPDGQLVIRVRKVKYFPVQQRFHTNEVTDSSFHVTQRRD